MYSNRSIKGSLSTVIYLYLNVRASKNFSPRSLIVHHTDPKARAPFRNGIGGVTQHVDSASSCAIVSLPIRYQDEILQGKLRTFQQATNHSVDPFTALLVRAN